MSRNRNKIHYNRHLSQPGVVEVNRVSSCGEITWHSETQRYIRETREEDWVDCKKCLKRLDRELD